MKTGELSLEDAATRLQMLRDLKDGWYDGGGKAIVAKALDWFAPLVWAHSHGCWVFCGGIVKVRCDVPFVYPTPEGGVRFEWSYGDNELGAEFNPETELWELDDLEGFSDAYSPTSDVMVALLTSAALKFFRGLDGRAGP